MKKLTCLILLAALLLPLLALTEDRVDPIVGSWYVDMEISDAPSLAGYDNYRRFVVVITFEEDGTITRMEVDYKKDNTFEAVGPDVIGKWSRTNRVYTTQVLGVGEEEAKIEDGKLKAIILAPGVYYVFHKMASFKWYTEMIRK